MAGRTRRGLAADSIGSAGLTLLSLTLLWLAVLTALAGCASAPDETGAADVGARPPLDSDGGAALLSDLERGTARLVDETESFLRETERWEPVGRDEALWREVQLFEGELARVEDDWATRSPEARREGVRAVLETGRSLDRALGRAGGGDARVRRRWERIRSDLAELAALEGFPEQAAGFRGESGDPEPPPVGASPDPVAQ